MTTKQPTYNRIDNIPPEKRWQPGQSGNPNGRPKNSVTTILKNTSKETTKKIANKLTDLAVEGDLKAIDMFIDRTDGRVVQQEGAGDDNRVINFILSSEQGNDLIEGITKRLTKGIEDAAEQEEG